MASNRPARDQSDRPVSAELLEPPAPLWVRVLQPLASLKLTVFLLVLGILIVFIGTLAQAQQDIWYVVRYYFRLDDVRSLGSLVRSAFPWVELQVFFPRSFFPNLEPIPPQYGFPFPNGWVIGFFLFTNLTAAHAVRFQIHARGRRLGAGLAISVLGLLLMWAIVAPGGYTMDAPRELFVNWPSLRILWLLAQCTAVSLVLLAGCMVLFGKRAGMVLLHLGIGALMIGELLVGITSDEAVMQIIEGQTVNYALDTREVELALVRREDDATEAVYAIPQQRLVVGQRIHDDQLPVDVEVLEFMANSERRAVVADQPNPATTGAGLTQRAVAAPVISSTDKTGRSNMPAAYVRCFDKKSGRDLGVHLVSMQQWMADQPEILEIGDARYEVFLRYRHMYKPYSIHLIDVEFEPYMGTNTARSYASRIRLVDPTRNLTREPRIWMNNPYRYAGETFYQSSYGQDPGTGKEYTGLQVVTNRSWRLPYLACMMTTVGLLAQFGIGVARFQRRRGGEREPGSRNEAEPRGAVNTRRERKNSKRATAADAAPPAGPRITRFVPLIVVLLSAAWLLSKSYQPMVKDSQLHIAEFGRLPIMYEGRVKPFDTLARNSLRIISDRQTFRDANGLRRPAMQWLLDVIVDSEAATRHAVFRIHNLDVLDLLGLQPRQGYRYALEEFQGKLDEFDAQVHQARATAPDQRDLFAQKVLELEQRLQLYMLLRESFRVPQLRPDQVQTDIGFEMNRREQFARYTLPLAVPPTEAGGPWEAYTHAVFDALAQKMVGREPNPATTSLVMALNAYATHDARTFNTATRQYRAWLESHRPVQWNETKTDFEAFYNHVQPLYYTMLLYVVAFLLTCGSWFGWERPLNHSAFWLNVFALVVHTFALAARMYISGRPPVTNLYSSAIFIGWGCVILGLLFERIYRLGIGNMVASVSGAVTLLVAFLMTTAVTSFKGDTFTVLVAVLDTQFWLATHVTCITLGYSATLVAGLLGIIYILRGVLTRSLPLQLGQSIFRMTYGTVCFAIFFSFVGTVLGGLWADDSWGRFWGWDPKENGALIIVLWNAVLLHALWGRMIGARGLAVLAVIGNIVTAWSWFGVNELGVGLHSYGFTEGVLRILGLFIASQMAIMAVGLLPRTWWLSPSASEA